MKGDGLSGGTSEMLWLGMGGGWQDPVGNRGEERGLKEVEAIYTL